MPQSDLEAEPESDLQAEQAHLDRARAELTRMREAPRPWTPHGRATPSPVRSSPASWPGESRPSA